MTGSSQQRWNRVSYSKFAGIDLIKDLYTTSERAEPWRGAPNSTIISNAFSRSFVFNELSTLLRRCRVSWTGVTRIQVHLLTRRYRV
ncbi:hypothetical protein DTO212C5_2254 [Paecilomyces variotii]|nr:hypothetical protein DTO212C5_2254 [Paecilomyces variotii]